MQQLCSNVILWQYGDCHLTSPSGITMALAAVNNEDLLLTTKDSKEIVVEDNIEAMEENDLNSNNSKHHLINSSNEHSQQT